MGSLGLTCNGISPKMSRLKLSACLLATSSAVHSGALRPSCAMHAVAIETHNIAPTSNLTGTVLHDGIYDYSCGEMLQLQLLDVYFSGTTNFIVLCALNLISSS